MLYLLFDRLWSFLADLGVGWLSTLFTQAEFRALLAAGLSFAGVVLAGKPVIRTLRRLKIGDAGGTDAEALRAHAASKANVPTMGGVLICGAVLLSTLLLADLTVRSVQLALVVLLWLSVLGGFDDWLKLTASSRGTGRQGLFAWEKLAFQIGLGLLVGYFAHRSGMLPEGQPSVQHVVNLPGQRTYEPGNSGVNAGLWYMSLPVFVAVAVVLITGLSNAVNITDGMDGLAGGIGAVVGFGLIVLTLVSGSEGVAKYLLVPHVVRADELAITAGAMAGACLGFLWWNCAPAQVFMGDTGSLALGGLIAYIAVSIRQEFVVLMMCGVFIAEAVSVMVQVAWFKYTRARTGTGQRILRCAPLHHHFHLGGWTESQTVQRLWIVSILLAVVAFATLKLR